MPITQRDANFNKKLSSDIRQLEAKIIATLIKVGEICVREAKANGDYVNRTGRLRNSIGFVVSKDSRVIYSSSSNPPSNSQSGVGIKLFVFADTEYAEHVEARGKNVLASSELMAEVLVPRLMKQLGFSIR